MQEHPPSPFPILTRSVRHHGQPPQNCKLSFDADSSAANSSLNSFFRAITVHVELQVLNGPTHTALVSSVHVERSSTKEGDLDNLDGGLICFPLHSNFFISKLVFLGTGAAAPSKRLPSQTSEISEVTCTMMLRRFSSSATTLKKLACPSPTSPCSYTQKALYVDVKMKWKKDQYYDSIEMIDYSRELRAVISLKNCIIKEPDHCIPISAISKRGNEFGVSIKVAQFLRKYPSIFEEFKGEKYNLPWFRLSNDAINLHKEEQAVYTSKWSDLIDRLKKLVLMSREKELPLKVVKGMQWYLGLPDDILENTERGFNGIFRIIEMDDGSPCLKIVEENRTEVVSQMQKNATKRNGRLASLSNIAFPLFPSKGLRLKQKISDWLDEFQRLPYTSPYESSSLLDPNSDISEKRVVGVLHELLSLFVDHSAERKKLLCLRKYFGLPQKFHKAFERHPHIFYLSLNNKTCTAILKEAYCANSMIEEHPVLGVRKMYLKLMKKSEIMLKERRKNKPSIETLAAPSGLENVGGDQLVRKAEEEIWKCS